MHTQVQPIFDDGPADGKQKHFSVEKLLLKASRYWPGFVVSIVIGIIAAYFYMQYATPVYITTAKLLVKDDRKGGLAEGRIFEDMGVKSATSTVDNEIEIFKSKMLMREVVSDLHLNIRYYIPGRFKDREIYNALPFKLVPLFNDSLLAADNLYHLAIAGNEVSFRKSNGNWKGKIGDTVALDAGRFYISPTNIPVSAGNFEADCLISPVPQVADDYINALDITAINKQVSIVKIQLYDIIPSRGEDVVNKLMDVYMQANVDDRNRVAESTIEFIDDRLAIVIEELSGIENEIKSFKQQNNLTNVEEQSKALLDYSSDNTKQLTQQEIQLSIVRSLESFLTKNAGNTRAIPSTSFVQDLSLTAMVNNYNNLLAQKERLLMSNTPFSPYIKNIDAQLKLAREDMKNNLSSLRHGLELSISEMKSRMGILNSEIKEVPAKEQTFLEYSRQQNIKQELYLFLLKKREETAISKSSTTPNARIVDVAESNNEPVAPKPLKVYLSAIVLALLIPSVRVLAKEVLNIKVNDRETIADYTSIPVIAEISHSTKSSETVVVKKNSRSRVAEQFRALRTNLQFLLTSDDERTILVTSSMSGEGKSFISLNLAATLALSGKRVILLELDLRKPQISEALGIDSNNGFSGYAIGKSGLDEVIKPSGQFDNLYILSAGTIPPNPSELLMMPAVSKLFGILKEQFDIIIIDTAPVGLVTDAQILSQYADATLYIVRQKYTYKQQLEKADQLYTTSKLPRMNIILNDTDSKFGGYGEYGNGYFDDDDKRGIKSLFNSKKTSLFKR